MLATPYHDMRVTGVAALAVGHVIALAASTVPFADVIAARPFMVLFLTSVASCMLDGTATAAGSTGNEFEQSDR